MPIPKPLPRKSSKSKKRRRMANVMHDLKHGKHHGQRTRKQEIAIAIRSAGMAKNDKRTSPRRGTRTQRRKKRSSSRR